MCIYCIDVFNRMRFSLNFEYMVSKHKVCSQNLGFLGFALVNNLGLCILRGLPLLATWFVHSLFLAVGFSPKNPILGHRHSSLLMNGGRSPFDDPLCQFWRLVDGHVVHTCHCNITTASPCTVRGTGEHVVHWSNIGPPSSGASYLLAFRYSLILGFPLLKSA